MPPSIADIAWDELEHAYGPAVEVPALLRALASEEGAKRKKALRQLEDLINHQGLASPAAVEAAPFVAEQVGAATSKEHPMLLKLLVDLMVGGSHWRYLAGDFEVPGDGPGQWLYQRCASACPRAIELLADKAAAVRSAAALFVAFAPSEAATIRGPLLASIDKEKNAGALASELLALGLLNRYLGSSHDSELLKKQHNEGDGLVKLAAAAALCNAEAGVPAAVEDTLFDALAGKVKAPRSFAWSDGDTATLAASVLTGWAAARGGFDLLMRLLDATQSTFVSGRGAAQVIDRVFDDEAPVDQLRTLPELSDGQRSLLEKMASLPVVGGAEVYFALQRHGIHGLPRDLKRFLGLDEQGPLDRVVDGEPAWSLLRQVRDGKLEAAVWITKLRAELEPAEVVALCGDAGAGGYTLGRRWPWFNVRPEHEMQDFDDFALLLADTMVAFADGEALSACADALLEQPNYAAMPAYAAVARAMCTLEIGCDAGELDQRIDRLAYFGMGYPNTMRDVIAALPPLRQWALLEPKKLGHVVRGSGMDTGGAWPYIDLCSDPRAAELVVSTVAGWEPNAEVPRERAIEVLVAMGAMARPFIEAALATDEISRRDVLQEALEALPSQGPLTTT